MEFEKKIVVNEVCQATISVKIPKEEIQKEYEALVLKYSKELALPGFRRGKVPVSLLNAKYSKAILEDLSSNVIKDVSDQVFQNMESEHIPLFPRSITFTPDGEFNLGVDWAFTIQYDVKPEVKIEKDEGLVVKVPTIYVSDEDVQKELETIRERNALIQDRGDDGIVQEGDLVTVDYKAFDDENQEKVMQDYTFIQNKSSTHYFFENDVLGMKKGETKEVIKDYGDDCAEEALRGKTRRILITIKAIKEKNLPQLDDDLAQDVSEEYKTLDDLKKDIKARLEKHVKSISFEQKRDAVIEVLARENNVQIPESLLIQTFNERYEDILRNYKVPKEELEKVGYSLYKALTPSLTLGLQGQFIMEALFKKYEINIDDEGLQAYLQTISNEGDIPMDMFQAFLNDPNEKEKILRKAEERKICDTIFSKSTFEESEKISLSDYIARTEKSRI